MADLRSRDGISARALELTILTAGRTGEVIGARWSEFDVEAKVWTIPAERMKGGREHRVPLNDRAIAILTALPREGDGDGFVFIGARAYRPLSNMAMLERMRGLRPGYVPCTASAARSAIGRPRQRTIRITSSKWRSRMRRRQGGSSLSAR